MKCILFLGLISLVSVIDSVSSYETTDVEDFTDEDFEDWEFDEYISEEKSDGGLDETQDGNIWTEVAENENPAPLLGEISKAVCECFPSMCICCSDVYIAGKLHDFCLKGWIEAERLAVGLDVMFDGSKVKRFEISAQTLGKLCAPLPFPPPFDDMLNLCVGNYYLDMNLKNGTAMICIYSQVSIGIPLFTVDFNCFKYSNNRFSLDTSIDFRGKGLLHLDLATLKFELNVPDEIKELMKKEAQRLVEEYNKCETVEEKTDFFVDTYWRYTPMKYVIDGVDELAPKIPGAVQYAIIEATDAIDSFATECADEMNQMNSTSDKIGYMMKRLSIFSGAGLAYHGYKRISPFIEGIASFVYTQISTAIESLIVDILKEASTYNSTSERAAFLAKKYFEYTPAGVIVKLAAPVITSVADMAVEKIQSLTDDVRDNLIANLTSMDNPIEQTYHILKTIHRFTPVGMLLSYVEPQLDEAYEAIKRGITSVAFNAADELSQGYENAETTEGKLLYIAAQVARLSNPIGLIISLMNWG